MLGSPAAWTALAAVISTILVLIGVGFRLVMSLTRLVDSVKSLNLSVEKVIGSVGDHEQRITVLEAQEKMLSTLSQVLGPKT